MAGGMPVQPDRVAELNQTATEYLMLGIVIPPFMNPTCSADLLPVLMGQLTSPPQRIDRWNDEQGQNC